MPTGRAGELFYSDFMLTLQKNFIFRGERSGKFKLLPNALWEGAEFRLNNGREIIGLGSQIRCEHHLL